MHVTTDKNTHGAWALLPACSLPFSCVHIIYVKVGQNYNIYTDKNTYGAWVQLPACSLPFSCVHIIYVQVGQNYNIYTDKNTWCVGSTACVLFAFFLYAYAKDVLAQPKDLPAEVMCAYG